MGSGWYIGGGGEYGGGATGPGEAGVLTRLTGVIPPGVIILTLTGHTGDLFTLLDLLGTFLALLFLAKDTDHALHDDCLVDVGV